MLNIVCCESVTEGETLFSQLGQVTMVPDQDLSPATIQHADALIARSTRKIDAALLENSAIKFVATATAGYDHLAIDWLQQHNIAWRSAPGCNANSVAEYLVSALLFLHKNHGVALTGKTLGLIGFGAVGSHVAEKARILGLNLLLCDPPLAQTNKNAVFTDLSTLLAQSDFVSLHVPLITSGPYRTYHLADAAFFARMKPGAVFINTARGDVADYAALLAAINSDHLSQTILDVWPNEPEIDPALLKKAAIATPHIAGHSYRGKLNGTWQAYIACCEYFKLTPTANNPLLNAKKIALPPPVITDDVLDTVWDTVKHMYDVEKDSLALKAAPDQFKQLRQCYFKRMEFGDYKVDLSLYPAVVQKILSALRCHASASWHLV